MRVIILSYYSPPLNAITSNRAYTLAKTLVNNGVDVDIVTRHWTGLEGDWFDLLKSNKSQVYVKKEGSLYIHYLPYHAPERYTKSLYGKVFKYLNILNGNFNYEIDTSQFYPYLDRLVKQRSYNVLYVTSPPLNILKVGSKIAAKNNLKFIADFRDLYNSVLLKKASRIGFSQKVEFEILKFYLKKYLRNTFLISVATPPIAEFVKSLLPKNDSIVLLNGYEKKIFENLSKENTDYFQVSLIGTLYPSQDINILCKGINLFLNQFKNNEIRVNFIGVGAIESVKKKIDASFSDSRVRVTDKLPRNKALQIGKDSSVLFYAGWKGYKGVYSGKIFEYLGLKNNILIAPGDHDVIDSLIEQTKSGKVVNNEVDVSKVLSNWFQEWKQKGKIKYDGYDIEQYSRENQNIKIYSKIIGNS